MVLSKLLVSIGKVNLNLVINLGSSLASTYLNKNVNNDSRQVEVTLTILSTLCELLSEKRKDNQSAELLSQVLTNIVQSDLIFSQDVLVKYTVIEILSR